MKVGWGLVSLYYFVQVLLGGGSEGLGQSGDARCSSEEADSGSSPSGLPCLVVRVLITRIRDLWVKVFINILDIAQFLDIVGLPGYVLVEKLLVAVNLLDEDVPLVEAIQLEENNRLELEEDHEEGS